MERGHVVQSLRCRHFIHEWNWQSAAAPAFPHLFPHPPLERLFKCFLRRRHAGPLVSESSRSVSTSATAAFRLSKVCCPFQPPIGPQKPQKKLIAAVMTIKQIIICLMFPVSSRCQISMPVKKISSVLIFYFPLI